MSAIVVRVNAARVQDALAGFSAATQAAKRTELMSTLGQGQLVSVYKAFAEEGSPSGSWAPLSEVSKRWGRHAEGNKLLIRSGLLRNSIRVVATANSATIGTNLRYAGVHQYGYSGPQSVKGYSYTRSVKSRDESGSFGIVNKRGRKQTVRRRTVSGVAFVTVRAFTRNIRIPARPFLVFRPEDPERIGEQVRLWELEQARAAGLEVK